jgi:CheY-like chemotaxis protein
VVRIRTTHTQETTMPVLAPVPRPQRVRNRPSDVTVLLADGDEAALGDTRRFLLLQGYEVATASGGVECLDQLRRLTDPVLVLNYELPWGGGDGVLALMREDAALAGTPVILTTTQSPRVKRAGPVTAAPPVAILEKPVVPEVLLGVIRGVRPPTGSGGRRGAEGRS